ncbi:hypothetical protein ABU614_10835 [Lysobacter firmicutimachus]|uniref:Secreted protein n=1 Tax=Lysobacter firmicutimachus TaxID=1792846 RepID=A0AAU8MY43_9GAMM
MLRICLCLLFAFASATLAVAEVGAREVNKLSPNDACSSNASAPRKDTAARPGGRTAPPPTARDTKAKPSVHSDSESNNRLQSPRWHNFLPGMFR